MSREVGTIHWSWLTYTVPDHIVIDIWRYIIVIAAFFAIGAMFTYLGTAHRTPLHTVSAVVNTLVALWIVLQEVNQLGRPMLVWRLPYETVILAGLVVVIILSRRHRTLERP